jgi:hypothetical protein
MSPLLDHVSESTLRRLYRYQGPKVRGWFWAVVGLGLCAAGFWRPDWFVPLLFNWFRFPVGVLAVVYGAILLVWYYHGQGQLRLTPEELERYGNRLSEATPDLVKAMEAGTPVREVAERWEKKKGVPKEVTLRYAVELARAIKKQQETHKPLVIRDRDR